MPRLHVWQSSILILHIITSAVTRDVPYKRLGCIQILIAQFVDYASYTNSEHEY
jgi:hypothetical protein